MAIFNEILVGRFNRALQKHFGIKGSPPVRQLAGEIAPSFQILSGVENRYLESWDRYAAVMTAPGVAAQRAAVQLSNPLGSNVIAVVEKLLVANTNAAQADVPTLTMVSGLVLTPFGATAARLDRRSRPSPNMQLFVSSNAGAISGSLIWRASLPALSQLDVIFEEIHAITILPGDQLTLFANVLNTQAEWSITWRERYLEESERS